MDSWHNESISGTIYTLLFFISDFRRVLNVVFFLFGDSPASEFYMPTFRNSVCSIFIGGVSRKNNQDEFVEVFIQVKVWLKNSLTQSNGGGMGKGRPSRETGCGWQRPPIGSL